MTVLPERDVRPGPAGRRQSPGAHALAWTVATLVVVQTLVCGLALLPVLALWWPLVAWTAGDPVAQVVAASFAVIPSYVLFAVALMFASAAATRVTGWRTRPDASMRLTDLEWPLLDWVRLHGGEPRCAPVRGHAVPGDARLGAPTCA